jgi:NAD(P)-dependent dehydrogenase (short-subunit alcohol dehydrogenase family)
MLKDKVIIVTGAASGIGRAAAIQFAQAGAVVIVADIAETGGGETAHQISESGGSSFFIKTDVASEDDVKNMVNATIAKFGRLDGAFNNAGIEMHVKIVPDLSKEEFLRVQSVNLVGVFLCMKYEMAAMKSVTGGSIVNTASIGGMIGVPLAADYIASKHGVVGLTRAASTEFRQTNVRVNAVLPGAIMTPMVEERLMSNPEYTKSAQFESVRERHSVGRLGKPDDVAFAAKWLLSDEAAFINGVILPVDGGYTAR